MTGPAERVAVVGEVVLRNVVGSGATAAVYLRIDAPDMQVVVRAALIGGRRYNAVVNHAAPHGPVIVRGVVDERDYAPRILEAMGGGARMILADALDFVEIDREDAGRWIAGALDVSVYGATREEALEALLAAVLA